MMHRTLAIIFALTTSHLASAQSLNRIGGFSGGSYDPAQSIADMNYPDNLTHRFRIIQRDGTNAHCDLQPLFNSPTKSPMTKHWKYLRGEIAQVHAHGLLLTQFNYSADGDRRYNGRSFCITNYPGFGKLTDGKKLECFAIEIGQFQFRDFRGITRTVPLYDHGLVYDPYALARSNALARASIAETNGPAPPK